MERISRKLLDALKFIQPHIPLIDSHMVAFFTSDLWENNVPTSIKNELNAIATEEMVELFSHAITGNHLKFKELSNFVQSSLEMDLANTESLNIEKLLNILQMEHYNCKRPVLNGFMSEKKAHEAEVLVEIIAMLTDYTGVTHVVEIGDGKGYTSTLLALQHGIKVLGLESSELVILGAQKRKSKLYKYWKGSNIGKSVHKDIVSISEHKETYRQTHLQVTSNTNIGQCVQNKFPEDWPLYSLALTGLHTCGDLSPICLHLFTNNNDSLLPRFLINIGCCYHLLNCSEDQSKNISGFPLSNLMKQRGYRLSKNARMMSLQAPYKLFHSKTNISESLMFRAVLEQLLNELFGPGEPKNREVGRIGTKCTNFIQYVRKASTNLGCQIQIPDNELEAYYKKYKPMEKKFHAYYLLRAVLAPVVEGIILLDRLLFLKEQGVEKSYLVKLFDPTISPRCYGIIAVRNDYHSHTMPPSLN